MFRPREGWRVRSRQRLVTVLVGLLVLAGAAGVALVLLRPVPAPGARLQVARPDDVHVHDPVVVAFGAAVDTGQLRVSVSPGLPLSIQREPNRLVVTPRDGWHPARRYQLRVDGIERADHLSGAASWAGGFTTQQRLTPAFMVDGQALTNGGQLGAGSQVTVQFPAVMRPQTTAITLNGATLPGSAVSWAADRRSAAVSTDGLLPGWTAKLGVGASALTTTGDPLTDGQSLQLSVVPTEPSGPDSGVDAGFRPVTPIMAVVENSGPARPQSGFQQADMVYEYVSEYSISRMTAIYYKDIPSNVGPIRSCRLINTFLGYAYDGDTMCSGVSTGTHVWMFGEAPNARHVPAVIDEYDHGHHFYRGAGFAPHNLYLRGGDADRARSEMPQPPADFAVAPPHPDAAVGDPAPPPSVPLHAVTYTYDGASQQYLRFDHGTPFMEASTGRQLHVKTLVLMHVPFHDAGYTEDVNGGAHSIWYSMLGSGPADVYADGRVVHATWHMGSPNQYYYWENHTPVWFTDPSGKVMNLDTGLTWVHVLGNGQTS